MFERIEKLVRVTRWWLAPHHCLPLWWHVGRPNFGDDINPTFFGAVSGRCTRFASDRRLPHVLGAVRGEQSLAAFAPRGDVFLGDPIVLIDARAPAE